MDPLSQLINKLKQLNFEAENEGEKAPETEPVTEPITEEEKLFNVPLSDGGIVSLTQEEYEKCAIYGVNDLNKKHKEKQNSPKEEKKTEVKGNSALEKRLGALEARNKALETQTEDGKVMSAITNTIKAIPEIADWHEEILASVVGRVAISKQQTGQANLKEILKDQIIRYKTKIGKTSKTDVKRKMNDKKTVGATTVGAPAGETSEKKPLGRKAFRSGELAKGVLQTYQDLLKGE